MLSRKIKADRESSAQAPIAIVPPPDRGAPAWRQEPEQGGDKNSLDSFKSENAAKPLVRADVRTLAIVVLGVALCVPASWFAWQGWKARAGRAPAAAAAVTTGTVEFNSVPHGATIAIDGITRGVTPIRLTLPAGTHTVELATGTVSRSIPISVEAGAVISQYIELAIPAASGGRIEVSSDSPGAQVRLDGVARGVTPLVLNDVPPGQHTITVVNGGQAVNRAVNVTLGATSTVVISGAAAPAASGGWLTFDVPIEMEISENDQLLGTTRTDRLMLPVGQHRITLSNQSLEFETTRTVQIAAGRTATIAMTVPAGRLSVNAVPWADVSIDGSPVGVTPLGQLSVPIGTHDIAFRHPQLGERRQTVTVKAQTPTRIGVDLRK